MKPNDAEIQMQMRQFRRRLDEQCRIAEMAIMYAAARRLMQDGYAYRHSGRRRQNFLSKVNYWLGWSAHWLDQIPVRRRKESSGPIAKIIDIDSDRG